MGRFDDFRKSNTDVTKEANVPIENPTVACEIQEPMERMVARMMLLDETAHNFMAMFAADELFQGLVDVDEEWRCWMDGDKKASRVYFDETLEVLQGKAYEHFLAHYAEELKAISDELAVISKMGQSLDEFKIFKTALYNVFNNRHKLPSRQYFEQVYSRAADYGMTLERPRRETMDLKVSFRPLEEVSRGGAYLAYELLLEYNPNHKKDGYMYAVRTMDAFSADASYSGPVTLPIYGHYSEFEKHLNDYFLNEGKSLFHYQAVKYQRTEDKKMYDIPADYFEGTFIDKAKLVDFSDKSYQYGNSKIFIPKSQIAFAGEDGERVYIKRWLFNKLKGPIENMQRREQREKQSSLDRTLTEAKGRAEGNGEPTKDRGQSMGK